MKKLFSLFILSTLVVLVTAQVPQLWGISGLAGTSNKGTVFNLPANGSSFTADFSFGALDDAAFPQSTKLCQASNGLLYGVTSAGGAANDGLIFSFNPQTRVYTDVFEFNYTDGSDSWGSLIQASNGLLYGMTSNGGTGGGGGVIFSFDPSTNQESVLYNFGSMAGAPQGSLVQGSNGKLYGMTELGGSPGFQGNIFSFDPTVSGPSAYQNIYAFSNVPSAVMAVGSLIQGVDGLLYGMTEFGGTNQDGNVFSIDTLGNNYSDLVNFDGTNGENPFGDLIQAKDGKFYGLTPAGGAFNLGNLFSYDPVNGFHDIYDFNGASGDSPYGNMLQASDGNLYGMTFADGSGGAGSIFSIVPGPNTFTPLVFFNSANSGTIYGGANPTGSLMQASNGLLYGMTFDGGYPQSGNLFSFDINPSNPAPYIDYVDFESTTQGAIPYSFGYVQTANGVVQGSDGLIYGMTFSGGTGADQWSTDGGDGTLYSFNPATSTYKELYDFKTLATPYGTPLMASDGKLYGLTFNDGANLAGTIYSLDTFGNYTELFDFVSSSDALGESPYGGFVQASNGLLYGMTSVGGNGGLGSGVIFSFNPGNPSNPPAPLYTFTGGTDGGLPYYGASLIQAENGLLYGTTLIGGSGASPGCTCGNGVVFSFDPNPLNPNPENAIWAFDGVTSGLPGGALVQANNGLLYGMGGYFGANSGGTLFSVDTLGNSLKVLVNFDNSTGDNPIGGQNGNLWQASDGKLYGGTEADGAGSAGALFSFDTTVAVNYSIIHSLNGGSDGGTPLGSLIELRNISTSTVTGSPFCAGTSVNVPFVAAGYYTYANVFTAQLSDASGNFSSPVNIGTLSGATSGTIAATIPGGTSTGSGYRIRVVSSSPVITGSDNGSNITINAVVTPSVSIGITGGTNPTCSGVSVMFTASPTNGGSSPTYNFEVNSSSVQNTTSATYSSSSLTNGAVVTVIMTSDAACPSPATATSSGITMTVNACGGSNTWLGHTSDWGTNTNWSSGSVPSCSDVEDLIPVTSNNPVISVAENASNLVINDGVTVTVNAALNVCGNLTGGTSTAATIQGSTALTLTGTALQTISGIMSFQNQLAVDNTLGSTPQAKLASGAVVNIYDALVLQNDNTLDASLGTLTLKSTSVTQAAIIDNFSGSNSGTVTGNITAERFYGSATASNDFKQHMLGSPVSGINLSALGSTSGNSAYYQAATGGIHNCNELLGAPGTPYGNVFTYDETHASTCTMDGWKIGAASTAVSAGTGYSVVLGSGSGTLSLTGPANLNSGYDPTTTNSGYSNTTSDQGRVYSSGINLVSNPYPASLSVSALNTANSTNFSGQTVYVWDVTTGQYDMNPATIAPFQAFKVIQSAAGSSTYSIPGTARTTTAGTFQRTTNPVELNMTVTNNNTGLTDNTIVGFNPGSTAQFDPSFDVIKLPGALTRHTMYSLNSNYWLAINVLKSIDETSPVPVGFEPGVSGTYTANFGGLNSFDPTIYIMLEDLQTGTMFNVRSGDYTFSSDATTDSWNRFVLHFTPPASITASNATCSEQGMINIVQPGTAIWNYTLADNNNVTLSSGTLNVNAPVNASVPAGVYTFTLTDNNGYTVVKTIEVNGVQPVIASFTASANSVNVNQEVTLNSTSNSAVVNNWNFGDGTTGNGVTVSHTYVNEGVYNVTLNSTSASGCNSSASNTITVNQSVTGLSNLNDINNILIWSNEDIVNVDFSQLTDVQANIEIYNILGQKLSEDKYVTSTVYRKEIPNIEEGYIVVSVKNNDEVISKKLFISNVK